MNVHLMLCPSNVTNPSTPLKISGTTKLVEALTVFAKHVNIDVKSTTETVHYWISKDGTTDDVIPFDLTAQKCHENGWMIRYDYNSGHRSHCFLCQSLMDVPGTCAVFIQNDHSPIHIYRSPSVKETETETANEVYCINLI
jgi:hypothetical protein